MSNYFGDMVSGISRLVKHGYERSHCNFWVQCDLHVTWYLIRGSVLVQVHYISLVMPSLVLYPER